MEPITCLMGMGDICIAYAFWLRAREDYGMDGLFNYFYNKRLSKNYSKNGINQKEVEDVCKIIDSLQSKQ